MRILITGGAGFIGTNFIYYLKNNYNDEIINLDKLTYAGNRENLSKLEKNPSYHFVKGDIGDKTLVGDIVKQGIDLIVNFAAESHVDRSIEDPTVFLQTNVLGTQVLLEAARKYQVQKFVQISTDEVYGSLGKEGFFNEESSLKPNSPYSASKAGADLMVRAYYQTYGLPVNITRCSNNYGPYQYPEKLIPLFITKAMADQNLPLYGDGRNIRDWIHVYDHCRAIDLVMREGRSGQIYNIGANTEKTNLEITREILRILHKPDTLIEFVEDRPGHDRRYAIDSAKIRRELNWRPVYNFADGLRETIKWYQENTKWWQQLKHKSAGRKK